MIKMVNVMLRIFYHLKNKRQEKNSGYQGSGEPSWLAVLPHASVRRVKLSRLHGKRTTGSSNLLLLLTLPYVLLHLADFNPYSSAFVSHNCEYTSFQRVL